MILGLELNSTGGAKDEEMFRGKKSGEKEPQCGKEGGKMDGREKDEAKGMR